MIGLFTILAILGLILTKSLYVEINELFIIIASLSIISLLVNLKLKKLGQNSSFKGSSAIIGFIFFWVYSIFDLAADHFLYFLPTANEDGRALTLGEKIQEFSDDLFIGSIIVTISVFLLSFVLTIMFSKVKYRST